jgi:uncharacterized protein YhfF
MRQDRSMTQPNPPEDAISEDPAAAYPSDGDDARAVEILDFWESARQRTGLMRTAVITGLDSAAAMPPPAWSFGDTPELSDMLLALVLEGTKTATASALVEFEDAGEPLPRAGDLWIALDGGGHPAVLGRTTNVRIVPFGEVDADHAHAEGEDDCTLATWRAEHERYFRHVLQAGGRTFDDELPMVLERFEVLYPRATDR